jgi:hypothetical protein
VSEWEIQKAKWAVVTMAHNKWGGNHSVM